MVPRGSESGKSTPQSVPAGRIRDPKSKSLEAASSAHPKDPKASTPHITVARYAAVSFPACRDCCNLLCPVEMEQFDAHAFHSLELGFIVRDLEAALPRYAAVYNLDTWFAPNYAEVEFKVRGQPVAMDLDIKLAFSGNTQIELIEATGPGASLYERHLAEHGEGLQHLGFLVPSVPKRLAVAQQLGLEVLQEGHFTTKGGGRAHVVYLDTRELCGIIVELIEVSLYGLHLPQTPFTYNLAAITGDMTKTKIAK